MFLRRRKPPAGVPAPDPDGTLVPARDAGVATVRRDPERPFDPAFDPGDEELMLRAQRGDLEAYNELVARHERSVFNVCLRLLRDFAAAEDAAQDTFVRAWTNAHTFRGGEVRPWLLRIATNRCYDILRAKGRRPAGSLDAEPFEIEPIWSTQSGDEAPDARALRGELSIHLERALHALPEDQRVAVILSDVQGLSYEEVAAATGAALGTVKSRLSRARARLRQALVDDPETAELFERYGRITGEGDGGQAKRAPSESAQPEMDSDDA